MIYDAISRLNCNLLIFQILSACYETNAKADDGSHVFGAEVQHPEAGDSGKKIYMYVFRARTRPTSLRPSCWRHPSSISLISKQMGANQGKENVLQILNSLCNAT